MSASPIAPSEKLTILVADDFEVNRLVVRTVVERMGHRAVIATDGLEAVRCFKAEAPDIVVMDVMMPGLDGFEATARIKALASHWVPVIFLTAMNRDGDIVRGLEVGGDDYLAKPISTVVLEAKIKAVQRTLDYQRRDEAKTRELERYYHAEEDEKRVAQHMMERLVHREKLDDELLRYWLAPARDFSGDLIAAARTPGNVLHVLLADGAGHGLSASLNVIPITAPFYAMTDKGFGIGTIARELNAKMKALLPVDRFVAATLVAVDFRDREIRIWNGGNPAALVLDAQGKVLFRARSRHLPLGILGDEQFDGFADVFRYDEPCQTLLCSDGLLEAENSDGSAFGSSRLHQILASAAPEQRADELRAALDRHLAGAASQDDMSLAVVDCAFDSAVRPATAPAPISRTAGCWTFGLELGASELRHLDVVPLLVGAVTQIDAARHRSGELFVILSELFNNALDHGVLDLDSAVKWGPDGLDRYLALRQERLQRLSEASVAIRIDAMTGARGSCLRIHCRDSGGGFDHPRYAGAASDSLQPFGRGIPLIRSLCASVEYLGAGNEVVALFDLEPPAPAAAAPRREAA